MMHREITIRGEYRLLTDFLSHAILVFMLAYTIPYSILRAIFEPLVRTVAIMFQDFYRLRQAMYFTRVCSVCGQPNVGQDIPTELITLSDASDFVPCYSCIAEMRRVDLVRMGMPSVTS